MLFTSKLLKGGLITALSLIFGCSTPQPPDYTLIKAAYADKYAKAPERDHFILHGIGDDIKAEGDYYRVPKTVFKRLWKEANDLLDKYKLAQDEIAKRIEAYNDMVDGLVECRIAHAEKQYEVDLLKHEMLINKGIGIGKTAFYLGLCGGGLLYRK